MRNRMSSIGRAALGLAPATIAASVVMTQPAAALDPGWYGGLSAGAALVSDSDLSVAGVDVASVTFDLGFGATGSLGYKFPIGWRLELEGAWRMADTDEGTIIGLGTGPVDGDVQSLSVMANVAYDISSLGRWQPYFGAGVGVAVLDAESAPLGINSDDTVFAYQGFVGLAFMIQPGFDVFGQYRYFATTNPDFDGVEAEVAIHNFEIGVRVNF